MNKYLLDIIQTAFYIWLIYIICLLISLATCDPTQQQIIYTVILSLITIVVIIVSNVLDIF